MLCVQNLFMTNNKSITLNTLIITALTLVANIIGMLLHIVLASNLGASRELDEFYIIVGWSLFFLGLVISAMNFSIIPRLSSISGNKLQFSFEASRLLFFTFCTSLLIFCFGYLLMPLVYELLYGLKDNNLLVSWVWLSTAILIFSNILTCLLNALRQQVLAVSLTLWPALLMVTSFYLFPNSGLQIIPQGQCLGALLSIILAAIFLKRVEFSFEMQKLKHWIKSISFPTRLTMSIGAMTCFSSYALIDSYWAPQISSGALSIVTITQRFMIAVGNFSVAAASVLMIPALVKYANLGTQHLFYKELWAWLRLVLLGGGFAALVLLGFGDSIMSILFVRGDFSMADAISISSLSFAFLPGNICMLLSVLIFRALFILDGGDRVACFLSVYWTLSYLFLSGFYLSEAENGLARAYLISWFQVLMMSVVSLYFLLIKHSNGSRKIG